MGRGIPEPENTRSSLTFLNTRHTQTRHLKIQVYPYPPLTWLFPYLTHHLFSSTYDSVYQKWFLNFALVKMSCLIKFPKQACTRQNQITILIDKNSIHFVFSKIGSIFLHFWKSFDSSDMMWFMKWTQGLRTCVCRVCPGIHWLLKIVKQKCNKT